MDRLTGQKRTNAGVNSAQNSQITHAELKRYKICPFPSLSFSQSQDPVFLPSLYKEDALRQIPTDKEFSVPGSIIGTNLFLSNLPNDVEATLMCLAKLFPTFYFNGRLPTIILSSQLNSILRHSSLSTIEYQLKQLVYSDKIIIFPTFSGSSSGFSGPCSSFSLSCVGGRSDYLIVFYEEFMNLRKHADDQLFQEFVNRILPYQSTASEAEDCKNDQKLEEKESLSTVDLTKSVNLVRLISKARLKKLLSIKNENDTRRLVNGGYLGIQDQGYYCLSLPGAGEFIKVWEKGRKVVLGNIKKAKFSQVLQQELERRPLTKTAPLGVSYHIADLVGSGVVDRLSKKFYPLSRPKFRDIGIHIPLDALLQDEYDFTLEREMIQKYEDHLDETERLRIIPSEIRKE